MHKVTVTHQKAIEAHHLADSGHGLWPAVQTSSLWVCMWLATVLYLVVCTMLVLYYIVVDGVNAGPEVPSLYYTYTVDLSSISTSKRPIVMTIAN